MQRVARSSEFELVLFAVESELAIADAIANTTYDGTAEMVVGLFRYVVR